MRCHKFGELCIDAEQIMVRIQENVVECRRGDTKYVNEMKIEHDE